MAETTHADVILYSRDDPPAELPQPNLASRQLLYDRFVFWTFVFTAHVAVILIILALLFI